MILSYPRHDRVQKVVRFLSEPIRCRVARLVHNPRDRDCFPGVTAGVDEHEKAGVCGTEPYCTRSVSHRGSLGSRI